MRKQTNGAEENSTTYWWDTVSGMTVNSTTKRSGGYSYYFSSTSYYAHKNIETETEIHYRFAVYMTAIAQADRKLFSWYTGTTEVGSLRQDTVGRFGVWTYNGGAVYAGKTTRALVPNQWNIIEVHLKIHSSSGAIDIKINNIDAFNYSGCTEYDGGIDGIRHGYVVHYLDDIALNNTIGTVNNSWCGDGHLELFKTVSNGDVNEWIPSGGALNWQMVDEMPPDFDTTFVLTSGIGQRDMYHVATFNGTQKNITIVWAEVVAKDNALGSGILKVGIKTNGTVYLGSGIVLSSVYEVIKGDFLSINPDTSLPWTADDINNIQLVIEGD